jgi:hypothetical protein
MYESDDIKILKQKIIELETKNELLEEKIKELEKNRKKGCLWNTL